MVVALMPLDVITTAKRATTTATEQLLLHHLINRLTNLPHKKEMSQCAM
jgi:hypothetical protein